MPDHLAITEILHARLRDQRPCATATIVAATGSIPAEVGAKMLVGPGGELLAGTVGGGRIELETLREAAAAIKDGKPRLFATSLTEAEAGGLGMMCGGTLQLFIEPFLPTALLVLVGGGHVSLAIHALAKDLGYRIFVVDDRVGWANPTNFPGAEILNLLPPEAFQQIPWCEDAYVIVATRDQDAMTTKAFVDQAVPARYLGMLSSKRKTIQILKKLKAEGVPVERIFEVFRSPVGLDIGGRSPAAIAVSVMAEIQMLRYGKAGRPMKMDYAAYLGHVEARAKLSKEAEAPVFAGNASIEAL